ncbi:MAG: flagellar hook-basal body complex protein [Sphingomonadales bacterium]
MSVIGALLSGVSGLSANSNALGMIGDNIVNINTVGYKATDARFSTLVTDASSATMFSSGGVQSSPQTLVDSQGLLQATDSATDLAIIGSGFFVTGSSAQGSGSGEIQFTRAGSFTPNADGFLQNTAGLFLKGWQIDDNGNIPTNLGDLSLLETINVSGLTGTAKATTTVQLRANLQATQTPNPNVASYDPTNSAFNMASGTGLKPDFERTIPIIDAQGGTRSLTFAFLKSATPNRWFVELNIPSPSNFNLTPPNIDGQVATGTLAFKEDGTLDVANTSPSLLNAVTIDWNDGPADSNLTIDFGTDGRADGLTQFNSASTLLSSSVNGAVFGNVTGVSITPEGKVTALFDNGLVKDVFQLPVATFQNPNGLTRRNGNAFVPSPESGSFNIQLPNTGGAGKISPSNLEGSTVDLASEFTKLITTQRAFTASTRIITTADEMLDELNRVKR